MSQFNHARPVFTARRVCMARTTPSQDVCPSVRDPSVRHTLVGILSTINIAEPLDRSYSTYC